MDVQKLIDIARECGQNDLEERLLEIGSEMEMDNAQLMLPLVGEFSSGKTTLINAVTDCKSLETSSKPTTAVIYQIFFGQEKSGAIIVDKEGNQKEIDDIASLKNEELQHNAEVVQIFDTCDKIPASTIIVDTPGLSSLDSSHRDALNSFLPYADAILLVTDVNQGMTKSLTDFIKQNSISKRPIYLIITKSDTKTDNEVRDVKEYIKSNTELNIKKIITVSAQDNKLDEFYNLLAEIDRDKMSILKTVNEQRIKNIAKMLSQRIDDLLTASTDDDSLSKAINDEKRNLEKLQRNIEKLINDTKYGIEELRQDVTDEFRDAAESNLYHLAFAKGIDLNQSFQEAIDSLSSQSFAKYKNLVRNKLVELANKRIETDDAINLQSLQEMDLESLGDIHIDNNIDLNAVGHQYDKGIGIGIEVLGTAAAVAAIIACPATVAVGSTTILSETALNTAELGTIALMKANKARKAQQAAKAVSTNIFTKAKDKVTEVFSNKAKQQIVNAGESELAEYATAMKEDMETIIKTSRQANAEYKEKYKGPVEGMVSKVTEFFAKPQKQRAINDFVITTLVPSFESQLSWITDQLLSMIQAQLNEEAHWTVEQHKNNLEMLKKEKAEQSESYKNRMDQYNQYKKDSVEIAG